MNEERNDSTQYWVRIGYSLRHAEILADCAGDYADMTNEAIIETAMNDYPRAFGIFASSSVEVRQE